MPNHPPQSTIDVATLRAWLDKFVESQSSQLTEFEDEIRQAERTIDLREGTLEPSGEEDLHRLLALGLLSAKLPAYDANLPTPQETVAMYAAAMLMPLIEAKKLKDWWASLRRMASIDIANMIGDARGIYRGENRESIARELTLRLCRPSSAAGIANLMEEMRDPYRGWKVLSALLTVRDVKRPEAPRDFKILFAVLLIEAGKTAIEAVWGNAVYDFLKGLGEHLQKQIAPTHAEGTSKTSSVAKLDTLVIESPIHLELVPVREGEFSMGSEIRFDPDAHDDEIPQHRVYLSEYYIGRFPVTVSQFESFVRARGYRTTAESSREEYTWRTPRGKGSNIVGKANHPVTRVSYDDAVAFCAWLKRETGKPFRLPTEAEWDKAARGTNGLIYPWGNTFDSSKLNYGRISLNDTTPVDKYPSGKSPYHAFDMLGNVWEWCADWYDANEYKRRANRVVRDPTGPLRGEHHVVRGGSWYSYQDGSRAADRLWSISHSSLLGFRVMCASATAASSVFAWCVLPPLFRTSDL